jgi:hypothetical protein
LPLENARQLVAGLFVPSSDAAWQRRRMVMLATATTVGFALLAMAMLAG